MVTFRGVQAVVTVVAVFINVLGLARDAEAARPEVDRLKAIAAAHPRDRAAMRKAIAELNVKLRARDFCLARANDVVSCVDIEQMLTRELVDPADRNILRMAMNDLMDVLGGMPGMDTLVACADAAGNGFTDVRPAIGGPRIGTGGLDAGARSGAPTTSLTGSAPSSRPGLPDLSTATATVTGPARAPLLNPCRAAQMSRIQAQLGPYTPKDPNYAAAVQTAVSTMDAAAGQCRDSANSAIAQPAAGTDNKPAPGTGGTKPPEAGEKEKGGEKGSDGEKVVTAMGVAKSVAEVFINAASIATNPVSGLAKTVAAVVSLVGGSAEVVGGNEKAGAAAKAGDVANAVIEVGTAGVKGELVEGVAALGFDAALPAAAVGGGAYAAVRLANMATGGAVDRATVGAVGVVSDAVWQAKYGSGSGGSTQRPDPTGEGKPSCAQTRQAWEQFKAYCSQPGNDWHTYDCMAFVARLNGCADPAIVNPGPEGDLTCHARCRGRNKTLVATSANTISTEAAPASCQEAAIFACEHREKVKGMLARPSGIPSESRPVSCRGYFSSLENVRASLTAHTKKKMCERANGGEFCDTPAPAGSGPAAPRPGARPTDSRSGVPLPSSPAMPLPTPGRIQ